MLLFNLLISGENKSTLESSSGLLTELAEFNIKAAKAAFPGLEYRLFDCDLIRTFLRDRFPPRVLAAFESLVPYSYKADLAKYCFLYQCGGVYFDLSYHILSPFSGFGAKPVVFRDHMNSAPWDTSVGLIYMPPGEKSMFLAIDQICAHVQEKYYGLNPLCPTGPALFGRILAQSYRPEELISGQATWLRRDSLFNQNNPGLAELSRKMNVETLVPIHCQTMKGKLVAIKTKRGGIGVDELMRGGNDYNYLWTNRLVYSDG